MKVIELMKIDQKVLELLHGCCIRIGDVRFVEMYEEYVRMKKNGDKVSYIVAFLSDKYGISERKVFYIVRKFSSECNICAV